MRGINFFMPLALVLSGASGCRLRTPDSSSTTKALPQNRYLIGQPADWVATPLDPSQIDTSMGARRAAAWKIVAKALQPVTLLNPETQVPLVDHETGQPLTLPAWQTWYEVDEFKAIFHDYYWNRLTSTERSSFKANSEAADQALRAFPRTPLTSRWTSPKPGDAVSRFERLLGQLNNEQNARAVNGVSGQGYTLFSPALIRHYLMHYAEVSRCISTPPDQESHSPADFATCFGEPFPDTAVAIKTTWNNVYNGVAVFDTTARGLTDLMTTDNRTWVPVSGAAPVTPAKDSIYTASTLTDYKLGPAFQLTGMHIITKELPHWMWVSLWWSPTPNSDFGEDRPDFITHLGGAKQVSVWANYKMCVASGFDEGDPNLMTTAAQLNEQMLKLSSDRSLRGALAAAYYFNKPHTFCSNPFIETDAGTGGTNCIGCHQYAGPSASRTKPQPEVAQVRKSFMSDFLWSFDNPVEQFQTAIRDVMVSPDN